MSILEENVIDSASIENGILILTISDHLKWDNEHLLTSICFCCKKK